MEVFSVYASFSIYIMVAMKVVLKEKWSENPEPYWNSNRRTLEFQGRDANYCNTQRERFNVK